MTVTATLESDAPVVGVEPDTSHTHRRRFTIAVAVGGVVVAVPYLWILTDLWNRSPSLLRTVLANHSLSNFYDLQARAMFAGHLYVTNGSFGQETFIHDGHHYTYFGLFPSLLRMPILLFTHSLDGRLTAPSILLSWVVTGVFSVLLLWRVRLLVRGPVALGWAEATTYGVLVATILGGSVLVYLAASPWVYSEDIAWSVALTIGSLFALLGILEAPSWKRVVLAGALILAASLTRGSSGYGCVVGALLASAWFASGRGEHANRRWWWPVLLAGVVPLVLASAVSWAKFGIPYGYPLHDQVYFNRFLKHIKGSYFSARYLPTTIATYLGFHGLNLSPVFPFVTLPTYPARAVGNVPLFGTQEVSSVPESMPLLFLLTIVGLIAALRRRAVLRARITVIPLIAAAAPCAAILIFGFLDNRFLGDFVPFLVLGSAVGAVDLWRRLDGARSATRRIAVGLIAALGLFGIVANMGIASTPTGWWTSKQALGFVKFQKSVGGLTGHPLAGYVSRGGKLPKSAPNGHLFILGDCTGLYIYTPNGIRGWLNLEKAGSATRAVDVTIHGSAAAIGRRFNVFTVGSHRASTVSVMRVGADHVRFVLTTAGTTAISAPTRMEPNRSYRVVLKSAHGALSVSSRQHTIVVGSPVLATGRLSSAASAGTSGPSPVSVHVVGTAKGTTSVCRGLISGS